MSSKLNAQTLPTIEAATFAGRQADLALLRGDYLASNVWWAIKVHLLYGRPSVQSALTGLSADGFRTLVAEQRRAGSDPAAAWWAIKRHIGWQKERAYAQEERIVAFRDRCRAGAQALV
jgi:hypothetical protein